MTYDGLVLAAVAAELRAALAGGRVSKIKQPEPGDVVITIRNRGADYRLLLSVDSQFPRVYLTSSAQPGPKTPPNFCMALRKYIDGAFVTGVEQVGFDRVLRLRLEAPDGNRIRLIHEIMGKHSNLIMVNDEDRVLGAAKVVTAAISKERQIIPGREYVAPPRGDKIDPLAVTADEFKTLVSSEFAPEGPNEFTGQNIRNWLIRVFTGIGPFLAEELILRGGGESITPESLWEKVLWLRELVASAGYSPVTIADERGRTEMVYPIPTEQRPPDRQHARRSLSEALDTYCRWRIGSSALESERTRLRVAAQRALSAREKTVKFLEQAVADGSDAEKHKMLGDLVLAHMGTIAKGSKSVKVVDYFDPSLREVEIPLEPELSPKENAERYFKRYRKARDGAVAAADRILETQTEIERLRPALPEIEGAGSIERLREIREGLVRRGLLRSDLAPEEHGKRQESAFGGMRIRRVVAKEGWEILVGENSLSNDYLTTKVAAPNDIWLHARSVKGAHVVIRTGNRPQAVSPATLRHAAEMAAASSDAKHSSLVPVDYTLRKHVRKRKGSAPGFVTYQNEKTIDVTPT